jgi:hypothetical protein
MIVPNGVDPPQPQQDLVPTGAGLVHQFTSILSVASLPSIYALVRINAPNKFSSNPLSRARMSDGPPSEQKSSPHYYLTHGDELSVLNGTGGIDDPKTQTKETQTSKQKFMYQVSRENPAEPTYAFPIKVVTGTVGPSNLLLGKYYFGGSLAD